MKRLLAVAAIMFACVSGVTTTVHAENINPYTVIRNDESGIPDAKLYEWLLANADYDSNGELTVGELEQLNYLSIYDTTGIESLEGMQYCKNLATLYLDGQFYAQDMISDYSPLAGLTKLMSLSLSYAEISDIEFLSDMVDMEYLSLTGNQITDITPLTKLTNLRTLWLEENQISDVTALAEMTHLEYLGLRENCITSTAPLEKLTELIELDISENQISDLSGLSGMIKLDHLDLSNNQITNIRSLAPLTQIRNLLLGQNQITDISALYGFTKLETLRLDENQISDISSLKKSAEILYLFLSGNQISDISALAFLPKVEWLEIKDNQLTNIRQFVVMTGLRKLDASNNQISDIGPLSVLENIEELRLDNNQIVDVSPLSGYQKLINLFLANNQIADPAPLEPLSELYGQLWEIDLRYNQIQDVSGISNLRANNMVNLYGNPYRLPDSELRVLYSEFVGRCYYALADDWISEADANYWAELLLSKKLGAKQLIEQLMDSEVFRNRQLDDEAYICALYMAITDCWPETEELEMWKHALATGTNREELKQALFASDKFRTRCEDYYIEMSIEPENGGETGGETNEQLLAFVERMYTIVLNREAVESEVNEWANGLRDKVIDGAALATGFVNSDEFRSRGLNDSDYVDVLYRALMNREANQQDKNYWISVLAGGATREAVLQMFIESPEFAYLCDTYGILAVITQEDLVRGFVERMYTVALGREAEEAGLEYWVTKLMTGACDGKTVVTGFVTSPEFEGRRLSNEDYVKTLYLTILGREAGTQDVADWVSAMTIYGQSRQQIMEGFINSAEFAYLCGGYGISAILTQRDFVTNFVERMYTVALGRAADERGLNDWVTGLMDRVIYGAQVADGFINSAEFEARNLSNEEYVKTLYVTFFNREAGESDVAGWVAAMTVHGQTRREVLRGFINAEEFRVLCEDYGIIRGEI